MLSPSKNSKGFNLNGATSSFPKVNINISSVSFLFIKILYSVLAGSITKNGNLLSSKSF